MNFDKYAASFGMTPSMYGASLTVNGKPFTIAGLRPGARSKPILISDPSGKQFIITLEQMHTGLAAGNAAPVVTVVPPPGEANIIRAKVTQLVDAMVALGAAEDAARARGESPNYDVRMKAEDEIFDKLQAISDATGEGVQVGKLISYGVADGKSHYVIMSTGSRVTVKHVPIGDAYRSPVVRNNALSRGHAEDACRAVDAWRRIFSKKKDAA